MVSTARDVDQAVVRGSELLKQGRLDDAQKVFRAALALDTENARVLALLGLSHFRAGQFADARPIYEQLVERTPTDASHRLNLGLVYLKLGDSDHAISALEASRALDPSQGRAVSYLGLAYARAGRYAEAYRSFLLAGQNELASEIEINLTQAERDNIHAQLQRTGLEPAIARTRTPPPRPPPQPQPKPASQDDVITEPIRPLDNPGFVIQSAAVIHMPKLEPDPEPEPSSSMEIFVERHAEPPPPPPPSPPPAPSIVTPVHELQAPRMTDSLQFVLPARDAIPKPADGQSMISQAVDQASPSQAATAASQARIAIGSLPPIPLSQLATDELVRPEDGDHPLEVSAAGALVVRVTDRVMTRLDGVHVTGGDLAFEPAQRRSRGHQTEDRFDYGGSPLHSVSGRGYLIALPGDRVFTAVSLDDDIFYLREDLVFAFQASLRWENGNVPGLRGRFPVVQFRGDGAVALRSGKPLVRVKLPASGVLFIDATRLAGWIGRVIPRAVVPPAGGPMGEVCVECTGEGVVLIDPVGDAAAGLVPRASGLGQKAEPAAPPAPVEAQLDLGDDTF
ncbi:MAG TPA: tetratricopeptide repeat protein [Kofleriaceae bacterium]